ncbi:MAG: hydroxymethylglutaryl-CoA lyase [Limisphaerales bacterium]|jgi:hydroxymethylglutaryl-CoA lyase
MSNAITIMEVSPRDGLQNESAHLSTEEKLQLIDFALASGSKRIEVTSFVHPKVVPQMADAEAVCAGLPQRGDVRYTGLVLNQRGYDRLRATERVDEAGIVISASDIFGEKNQGMNLRHGVSMAQDILRQGRDSGFPVQVTIAVAFGCPFSGDVAAQEVINIVSELIECEPCEIALADTIGVGVPTQVTDLFGALSELTAGEIPLRAHFHDTRNTGIANAQAAVLAGVTTLDASMGGIGGCPFAPNATGNIATEDLAYLLDRSGVEHDLDLKTLLTGAEWLQGKLGRVVPSALLKAGIFPAEVQP